MHSISHFFQFVLNSSLLILKKKSYEENERVECYHNMHVSIDMENTTTWIHENKFGLACGRSPPCMSHQNNMSFMFLGVCKINYLRVSKLITLCTRKSTELSSFPKFAEMAKSLCHTCQFLQNMKFEHQIEIGAVNIY